MPEVAESQYEPFAAFSAWERAVISGAWEDFLGALDIARNNATPEDVERALQMAVRSAALETGAIEGLYPTTRGVTRMVALQGALWEAELEKLGPDVRGHFDAQLAALELVLDVALSDKPLTESWIRSLQAQVCANQKNYRVHTPVGVQERALEHGAYKVDPNNVTLADDRTHWYCPVDQVAPEMYRLQQELRDPTFQNAHPVMQAAYAHHALTAIHPFPDGNGRTARALASMFLYRGARIPLVVFSDQNEPYLDALAAADRGNVQAFVTFIEERTVDAMGLTTNRLRDAKGTVEESAAALLSVFRAHGGLNPGEVAAVGKRLTDHLRGTLGLIVRDALPLTDFAVEVGVRQGRQTADFGMPYHTLPDGGAFVVTVQSQDPITKLRVEATPIIGLADDPQNSFTFIAIDANRPRNDPLRLRISGLHPAITRASEELIEGWARAVATRMIDELAGGISGDLKGRGY